MHVDVVIAYVLVLVPVISYKVFLSMKRYE
jgi:hypothetical protein